MPVLGSGGYRYYKPSQANGYTHGLYPEAAHKFCGMIAAFPTEAATVMSDLEDQAASGRLEDCRPLVEQLVAMARQLIPQLDGVPTEDLRRYGGPGSAPT